MPGGNRDEFLPEAETMAKNGIASILIDAPFARPEPWRRNLGGSDDPAVFTQAVIDLRRAVDLLISRSEIDSERIAFVGHSFGANMGGILAGVEKRIKYFVLMAGLGNQAEFMRNSQTPELVQLRKSLPADAFAGYTKSIEPFAAENYVKNSAPADLFFQAATNDEGITRAESKSYYAAASNPKTIKFYEAKHALNADAERDRISWLKKKLGNK
jgi:cephalosporin-C deacetylase-like acetyl esterase